MRKVGLFYTVLLIFIVLSACSATKAIANVDSNDNTEIIVTGCKIDLDEENCRLINVNHDLLDLENLDHLVLLDNLMNDIIITIDDKYGSPYSMVAGSFNYWYLTFTDNKYEVNLTFYSLDEENTQNYIIVEYVEKEEIIEKLVYSFSAESLSNLIIYANNSTEN